MNTRGASSTHAPQRGALAGYMYRTTVARLTSVEGDIVLNHTVEVEGESPEVKLDLEQHGRTWEIGREESCLVDYCGWYVVPARYELPRLLLDASEGVEEGDYCVRGELDYLAMTSSASSSGSFDNVTRLIPSLRCRGFDCSVQSPQGYKKHSNIHLKDRTTEREAEILNQEDGGTRKEDSIAEQVWSDNVAKELQSASAKVEVTSLNNLTFLQLLSITLSHTPPTTFFVN
jgi:hypothetical protein